ncbi:hypothetical protein GF319_08045 [Candidatus Bathyarchaeota archaeon]|nr:hypothetical protein [Candidatus Bathyarchaeota archaeon]
MTFMKRKGVSPVIATVVLVAVAITIAVAVSYWMSGISSQYTQFEKIEVTSAHCKYYDDLETDWNGTYFTGSESGWVITIDFRNTGTTQATIINAFINSMKIEDYDSDAITAWTSKDGEIIQFSTGDKVSCNPGSNDTIYLVIEEVPVDFTSGTTIEASLHSGAGNTYMKMITLS